MKHEAYSEVKFKNRFSVFEFVSVGPKGHIQKRVNFTSTEFGNVYNLGFGNVDEDGDIDDTTINNNGDMRRIFATITDIIDRYTEKYRNRIIMFQGNTRAKNRLYRMVISLNFDELSINYEIYVYCKGEYVPSKKNIDAAIFFIWRKN